MNLTARQIATARVLWAILDSADGRDLLSAMDGYVHPKAVDALWGFIQAAANATPAARNEMG